MYWVSISSVQRSKYLFLGQGDSEKYKLPQNKRSGVDKNLEIPISNIWIFRQNVASSNISHNAVSFRHHEELLR